MNECACVYVCVCVCDFMQREGHSSLHSSSLQVTQSTQSVSSPHHSDPPPPGPSLSQLTPEQKFETLKAEGNDHVKKVYPIVCPVIAYNVTQLPMPSIDNRGSLWRH